MKVLSPAIQRALKARVIRPAPMIEIDHPDHYIRAWMGIGTISWGGYQWLGVGTFGGVEGVQSSSDLQIVEHAYTLVDVDPANAAFVQTPIRGRRAITWLGLLGESGALIADPIKIAETTLDVTLARVEDSGSFTVTLRGHSALWQLEQPLGIALTSSEQKKRYPGDTGFDFIPTLVNKRLSWTRT